MIPIGTPRATAFQPAHGRMSLRALLTLVLMLPLWVACHDHHDCDPDHPCECSDYDECYLGCRGDHCDQYCHNLQRCGGVCDDDCNFRCHDMNDCTSFCGDDCNVDCRNVSSCGVICESDCDVTCTNVDRCGILVGPGSSVDCTSVSSCEVECDGDCEVHCQGTSRCPVTCLDGSQPKECGGGRQACGAC